MKDKQKATDLPTIEFHGKIKPVPDSYHEQLNSYVKATSGKYGGNRTFFHVNKRKAWPIARVGMRGGKKIMDYHYNKIFDVTKD